jgi:pimeloyl-ACP methyl ester carboxylesterase
VQSDPASPHELTAWQIGGVHVPSFVARVKLQYIARGQRRIGTATDKIAEYTMHRFKGAMFIALLALAPLGAYAAGPDGTQSYIEVRGAKLYTQIYGHGPPIVFLHGGMAFFDNSFAKQRDYFATYRTVVGIDQRGYGHSPDGPWSLSYQMMADDTAAIIQQLGPRRR